jgi:aspartate aminotransferase-like enzyme
MEAVARQFATNKDVLVLRNGYFSFRWSQIFQQCNIVKSETVLKAVPEEDAKNSAQREFSPLALEAVVAEIKAKKPAVVFAPHVETASGIILPDAYLTAVANAVHSVGGIFVLDCIASGCVWVDMKTTGVDVLISAPQKGWTGQACAGIVMMNDTAKALLDTTESTSFCCNLKAWVGIMEAYKAGGHKYYATMPTDSLRAFSVAMQEAEKIGFQVLKAAQIELGAAVRALAASKGIASVAATEFAAPGVVVLYDPLQDGVSIGKAFAKANMQIAGGVPLMIDNGTNTQNPNFKTFRLGLFGLDKLKNVNKTVLLLEQALDTVLQSKL